jgi:hypothetical protein
MQDRPQPALSSVSAARAIGTITFDHGLRLMRSSWAAGCDPLLSAAEVTALELAGRQLPHKYQHMADIPVEIPRPPPPPPRKTLPLVQLQHPTPACCPTDTGPQTCYTGPQQQHSKIDSTYEPYSRQMHNMQACSHTGPTCAVHLQPPPPPGTANDLSVRLQPPPPPRTTNNSSVRLQPPPPPRTTNNMPIMMATEPYQSLLQRIGALAGQPEPPASLGTGISVASTNNAEVTSAMQVSLPQTFGCTATRCEQLCAVLNTAVLSYGCADNSLPSVRPVCNQSKASTVYQAVGVATSSHCVCHSTSPTR